VFRGFRFEGEGGGGLMGDYNLELHVGPGTGEIAFDVSSITSFPYPFHFTTSLIEITFWGVDFSKGY